MRIILSRLLLYLCIILCSLLQYLWRDIFLNYWLCKIDNRSVFNGRRYLPMENLCHGILGILNLMLLQNLLIDLIHLKLAFVNRNKRINFLLIFGKSTRSFIETNTKIAPILVVRDCTCFQIYKHTDHVSFLWKICWMLNILVK